MPGTELFRASLVQYLHAPVNSDAISGAAKITKIGMCLAELREKCAHRRIQMASTTRRRDKSHAADMTPRMSSTSY
jgi:hypothetical protein